jgi:hypothetical protein
MPKRLCAGRPRSKERSKQRASTGRRRGGRVGQQRRKRGGYAEPGRDSLTRRCSSSWPIASRHRSVALIPVALASSSSWRLRSGCMLDFKSRRGVVCHVAKIRPPAEFPFNAPAFRRRSDAAQRPWQLRRRQKRAPAGAEAKVVLTPEAASHARHQHPYMARQLRRRYEQDGRASGPAATTACIDDAARCCIPCKRQQPDGRRPP